MYMTWASARRLVHYCANSIDTSSIKEKLFEEYDEYSFFFYNKEDIHFGIYVSKGPIVEVDCYGGTTLHGKCTSFRELKDVFKKIKDAVESA